MKEEKFFEDSVGTVATIRDSEQNRRRIPDLIGQKCEILKRPLYPATWYKVITLNDGEIRNFQSTAIKFPDLVKSSPKLDVAGSASSSGTAFTFDETDNPDNESNLTSQPLIVGTKVMIKRTSNVDLRAPELIGEIGTIIEVPVHPNTWFKVKFSEETFHTFRASALRSISSPSSSTASLGSISSISSTGKKRRSASSSNKKKSTTNKSSRLKKKPPSTRKKIAEKAIVEISCGDEESAYRMWNGRTGVVVKNNVEDGTCTVKLHLEAGDVEAKDDDENKVEDATINGSIDENIVVEGIIRKDLRILGGTCDEGDEENKSKIHEDINSEGDEGDSNEENVLLSTIDADLWVGRSVLVKIGKYKGEIGRVTRSGNGWVQLHLREDVNSAKRAYELELVHENGEFLTRTEVDVIAKEYMETEAARQKEKEDEEKNNPSTKDKKLDNFDDEILSVVNTRRGNAYRLLIDETKPKKRKYTRRKPKVITTDGLSKRSSIRTRKAEETDEQEEARKEQGEDGHNGDQMRSYCSVDVTNIHTSGSKRSRRFASRGNYGVSWIGKKVVVADFAVLGIVRKADRDSCIVEMQDSTKMVKSFKKELLELVTDHPLYHHHDHSTKTSNSDQPMSDEVNGNGDHHSYGVLMGISPSRYLAFQDHVKRHITRSREKLKSRPNLLEWQCRINVCSRPSSTADMKSMLPNLIAIPRCDFCGHEKEEEKNACWNEQCIDSPIFEDIGLKDRITKDMVMRFPRIPLRNNMISLDLQSTSFQSAPRKRKKKAIDQQQHYIDQIDFEHQQSDQPNSVLSTSSSRRKKRENIVVTTSIEHPTTSMDMSTSESLCAVTPPASSSSKGPSKRALQSRKNIAKKQSLSAEVISPKTDPAGATPAKKINSKRKNTSVAASKETKNSKTSKTPSISISSSCNANGHSKKQKMSTSPSNKSKASPSSQKAKSANMNGGRDSITLPSENSIAPLIGAELIKSKNVPTIDTTTTCVEEMKKGSENAGGNSSSIKQPFVNSYTPSYTSVFANHFGNSTLSGASSTTMETKSNS